MVYNDVIRHTTTHSGPSLNVPHVEFYTYTIDGHLKGITGDAISLLSAEHVSEVKQVRFKCRLQ